MRRLFFNTSFFYDIKKSHKKKEKQKKVNLMKEKVSICFDENYLNVLKDLKKLLHELINSEITAIDTLAHVEVEDDDLVIQLKKGFDCLYIPIKTIKKYIKIKEEKD